MVSFLTPLVSECRILETVVNILLALKLFANFVSHCTNHENSVNKKKIKVVLLFLQELLGVSNYYLAHLILVRPVFDINLMLHELKSISRGSELVHLRANVANENFAPISVILCIGIKIGWRVEELWCWRRLPVDKMRPDS